MYTHSSNNEGLWGHNHHIALIFMKQFCAENDFISLTFRTKIFFSTKTNEFTQSWSHIFSIARFYDLTAMYTMSYLRILILMLGVVRKKLTHKSTKTNSHSNLAQTCNNIGYVIHIVAIFHLCRDKTTPKTMISRK